jgi:hypothetical protein
MRPSKSFTRGTCALYVPKHTTGSQTRHRFSRRSIFPLLCLSLSCQVWYCKFLCLPLLSSEVSCMLVPCLDWVHRFSFIMRVTGPKFAGSDNIVSTIGLPPAPDGCGGLQISKLLTISLHVQVAEPSPATVGPNGATPDSDPFIQDLVRKSAEKREERAEQRLNDYYRRNYKVRLCSTAFPCNVLGRCTAWSKQNSDRGS